MIKNKIECKPFLRWAGGKNWFIKHLPKFLPSEFKYNTYHEPFIGGGSVLLKLQPDDAFISDINNEIIETYIQLRDNVDEVIGFLSTFKNTKEFYYKIRSTKVRSEAKNAAKFIFLNQTSFNGIYRVNLNGEYNVPYGNRKKDFFEPDNLKAVSQVLKNYKINSQDFYETIINIKKNDLIFIDPPYTVSHNNNGFIKYNAKLFNIDSQLRLVEYIRIIEEIGAHYILTNAAHNWIKENFKTPNNKIEKLLRASLIGGLNAKREKYEEYIITNIQ